MKVVLTTVVCLALLACASSAQAAQRFASPSGAGATCSQAVPCSLSEAMSKAKANDEVIIGGGAYNLPAGVNLSFEATGANVHGDLSGPPPTISVSAAGFALGIFPPKSQLSYVDVTNFGESGYAVGCGTETTVERIRATAKSKNGSGIQNFGGCTIRNSVIHAVGSEAIGLQAMCANLATARNLTVVATGEKAIGVRVAYNGPPTGSCTLDLKNAIVSGGQFDLQTLPSGAGPGNIAVEHSNFDVAKQEGSSTITQGAANQSAPPLFVDAANFDYHEAAGSPTIDAGVNDQPGSLDFDGLARIVGSAPDIGAFEFVPPPPAPAAAAGQIQSLTLAPSTFAAAKAGEAILSAKKKAKAPIGATVTYALSAKATAEFSVVRSVSGRKVKGRCVRASKANRAKKKCTTLKPISGGFTHSGAAGTNTFRFSGRIGGKALAPGSYQLIAGAGGVTKTANFKIVK